jgi:hypothetical protein
MLMIKILITYLIGYCCCYCRWQGSIYKILWRQVLVYFVTYIALGLIYKLALSDSDKM